MCFNSRPLDVQTRACRDSSRRTLSETLLFACLAMGPPDGYDYLLIFQENIALVVGKTGSGKYYLFPTWYPREKTR